MLPTLNANFNFQESALYSHLLGRISLCAVSSAVCCRIAGQASPSPFSCLCFHLTIGLLVSQMLTTRPRGLFLLVGWLVGLTQFLKIGFWSCFHGKHFYMLNHLAKWNVLVALIVNVIQSRDVLERKVPDEGFPWSDWSTGISVWYFWLLIYVAGPSPWWTVPSLGRWA